MLKNKNFITLIGLIMIVALMLGTAYLAFAQEKPNQELAKTVVAPKTSEVKKPILKPVLTNYKEVKIGMTADEVRERLGKTKFDDKDGFYYVFSKDEQAQIVLDKSGKVRVISITYSDKDGTAPKFADVFGNDVTPPAEGKKMYKLVRYPTSGYWVAYDRLEGKEPTVTITMQKLRKQ